MNKIFHIALESSMYSSKAITKGFVGKTVRQFNWQQVTYEYDRPTMRQMCVASAKDFQPDLIFLHCQNPAAFDIDTIKELQTIAPVVNYTFDVRQDISWFKEVAPHITLTLFACYEDVNDCKNSDIPNVAYMPSSADFEFYEPRLDMFGGKKTFYDIVFIGNDTTGSNLDYPLVQQRKDMVNFMYDNYPDQFMAYGIGQQGGLVDRFRELELYNNCKIVITHNHFFRTGYCSDRDWRAVGCGAMVIHHAFKGVQELFTHRAVTWTELEDLKFSCDYFLKNTNERIRLSEVEHDYVILYHSWTMRINKMFKLLKDMREPA